MTIPALLSSPDASPVQTITINKEWLSVLIGLVLPLTNNNQWDGTAAEQETAAEHADELINLLMIDVSVSQGSNLVIGSIIPHVLGTLPANLLACDGSQYLRTDYPELYAALDTAYIIDADTFKTPNLNNRFPLGDGSKPISTEGGSEQVTLTHANLPAGGRLLNPGGFFQYQFGGSDYDTSLPGQGTPISTVPPYHVVKFAIVASA